MFSSVLAVILIGQSLAYLTPDSEEKCGCWQYTPGKVEPAKPVKPVVKDCAPIAARSSFSSFYLFFKNSDQLWRYPLNDFYGILNGQPSSTKTLSGYHPSLNGKSPDAAFKHEENDVFLFVGNTVEVQDYHKSSYALETGYPKTIAQELGVLPAPNSVDAALLVDNTRLYLLDGLTAYTYIVSGSSESSPNLIYVYDGSFDWGQNGPSHPFSAAAGSPVPSPPTGVTALVYDAPRKRVLAFIQTDLYVYTVATQTWELKGTVTTPCDKKPEPAEPPAQEPVEPIVVDDCAPIAARSSDPSFYIFFKNNDAIWKYRLNDVTKILGGRPSSTKSKSRYHPDLQSRSPDAAFKLDGKLYFFVGNEVERHDYESSSYKLHTGYPKTITEELGVSPAPTSVDAALLEDESRLYLLKGNIAYKYTVLGMSPNRYRYDGFFEWSQNGPSNPFSAAIESPVPSPPTGVTVLMSDDRDGRVLAFVQTKLYIYTKDTNTWKYEGVVKTPCTTPTR